MLQSYDDLLDAIRCLQGLEVADYKARGIPKEQWITTEILWWDENGVPRLAPHHPELCPDIYATEVVLLQIACQACKKEFPVQMSWDAGGELLERAKAFAMVERAIGAMPHAAKPQMLAVNSLSGFVKAGTIHYGDPPHHDCASGVTMNCDDLRVIEFWSRAADANDPKTYGRDWRRVAELEIELPDAKDPDR
jgi:hypothetical protein